MTPLALSLVLPVLVAQAPQTDGGVVVVKGQRFLAEVAQTQRERERGLMYRTTLAKDRCMFFIGEQDQELSAITMKNCLIALDIIWIKADGTVVDIAEKVQPPSPVKIYRSDEDYIGHICQVPSRHFVEFPAGTAKRLGLKVGDRIGWDLALKNGSRLKGGLPVPAGGTSKKAK